MYETRFAASTKRHAKYVQVALAAAVGYALPHNTACTHRRAIARSPGSSNISCVLFMLGILLCMAFSSVCFSLLPSFFTKYMLPVEAQQRLIRGLTAIMNSLQGSKPRTRHTRTRVTFGLLHDFSPALHTS